MRNYEEGSTQEDEYNDMRREQHQMSKRRRSRYGAWWNSLRSSKPFWRFYFKNGSIRIKSKILGHCSRPRWERIS
jgi:hypothetical protein